MNNHDNPEKRLTQHVPSIYILQPNLTSEIFAFVFHTVHFMLFHITLKDSSHYFPEHH